VSTPGLILDLLLGLALVWLAWRTLAAPTLFGAIVLFIAFGLLMALGWARLDAPDIALAEAAVGAGLTGVLLLAALADLHQGEQLLRQREPLRGWPLQLILALTTLGFFILVMLALLHLPSPPPSLAEQVFSHLDEAGASHPVTAVLLDFRAWDTLLEIAVLLLAVIAAWSLGGASHPNPRIIGAEVLQGLVRMLIPFAVLSAGYLVWRGGHAPGGAFQAGTVLAAAGILLLLAGLARPFDGGHWIWRALLASGLFIFIAVALGTLMFGHGALDYPDGLGHGLILLIELGLTLAIGLTFVALYAGERGEAPTQQGGRDG
jgi:multisubunit Na+/H+ antiporter MnhB subunit